MGILSTLLKTTLTASPAPMATYRASIRLRDALLELHDKHNYTIAKCSKWTCEFSDISKDTDLSDMLNVELFVIPKIEAKLVLVSDAVVSSDILEFISETFNFQPNNLASFKGNHQIMRHRFDFLQFHPNVSEPHREISSLRMIEQILEQAKQIGI